jgi:NDP-sugar pyrophosphorylase family protein
MSSLNGGRSIFDLSVGGAPLYVHAARNHAGRISGTARFFFADADLAANPDARTTISALGEILGEATTMGAQSDFPTRDGRALAFEHPWHLLDVVKDVLAGLEPGISSNADVEPGTEIVGQVRIESGARLFGGARVKGPVYIGRDVVIGNNAMIRGTTSIADGCVAGFSSEIKNSLVAEQCGVGPLAIVPDSVLGRGCFVAGLVRLSNYRLDGRDVEMMIDGQRHSTGRRQFGAVLEPDVSLGIATIVFPGRRIGTGCMIGPRVNVRHNLEPNLRVEIRQELDIRSVGA